MIDQPMCQIRDGSRVGYVVALNDIPKQHRVEVLLLYLDAQHSVKASNFGETTCVPVLLKCVLDG